MSDADAAKILTELATVRGLLERLVAKPVITSEDLSVEEFAAAIGRKALYVYRRIASRQIAVRAGGKPYRIPANQVEKFRKPTRTV